MKQLAFALGLLVLGGCATTQPSSHRDLEQDFEVGHVRYKVTRQHGGSSLLLWREEGITWRLVSESPLVE